MKKRKRQRVAEPAKSSGQNPNNQLQIGPKIFSHQRLSAIYFSLALEYTSTSSQSVELNPETREEVFTHIATLLRIKLMQQVSATQVLDNIKYRCLATWELVQDAAKSLHFPVDMYLNNHL
uniref:Uncharacterized protein AlNc14C33G3012 n=1 Tax=Albugo laibachii Nc14 TaxID=890382 RepID=F0W835_9STRA|nr:conserved hypothetical protein [Albugo laibachii Nc14]|eukprot:CCA17318.1 conserved hypothetical protein [Albugo laibachii Nc14]